MIFPNMDEYQFATFFVVIKQEVIKQELQIERLYMENIIKLVYKYIVDNKQNILNKFTNQYDTLSDKKFLNDVIKILKKAKQNDVPMEFKF